MLKMRRKPRLGVLHDELDGFWFRDLALHSDLLAYA
jgi:hypothetical protein